jgi:hypothetical protein
MDIIANCRFPTPHIALRGEPARTKSFWQQSICIMYFLTLRPMYNITLVCTHHSEYGKCNSDELYKIIESIRPDIIFEELTQDLFDKFYKEDKIPCEPPEIKSVKRYTKDHITSHIPVDINPSDTLSTNEINYMFNTVGKYHVYSKLEEDQKRLAFQEGYDFLNSKKSEELVEKKKSLEKSLIEIQINKDQLCRIHDLFYNEQHNRENEIIKNIYNYSVKTAYNQALLLIGSGHRKTIFEKIRKYEPENHVKLNWALYGNQN